MSETISSSTGGDLSKLDGRLMRVADGLIYMDRVKHCEGRYIGFVNRKMGAESKQKILLLSPLPVPWKIDDGCRICFCFTNRL